ncbi:hypothetical protein AAMO2058_001758700, partial [Amorphochlora amoebiformis]
MRGKLVKRGRIGGSDRDSPMAKRAKLAGKIDIESSGHWVNRISNVDSEIKDKSLDGWIPWKQEGVPKGWQVRCARIQAKGEKGGCRIRTQFKYDGVIYPTLSSIVKKPNNFEIITLNRHPGSASKLKPISDMAPRCECQMSTACKDTQCINRAINVECGQNCPCGSSCENQRMRRKKIVKNEISYMGRKGWGFITKEDIIPGELVGEYIGELISREEKDRRLGDTYRGYRNFYLL